MPVAATGKTVQSNDRSSQDRHWPVVAVRFVRMILLLLAIRAGGGVVLRLLNPLPSLKRRSMSQALGDTADTPLGNSAAQARSSILHLAP